MYRVGTRDLWTEEKRSRLSFVVCEWSSWKWADCC